MENMKHAKKLLGLLLALAMVLSLGATAFATGDTSGDVSGGAGGDKTQQEKGTITINNTVKDTTYSIYRIFDLESYSDTTPDDHNDGAYSYKVNSNWAAFFATGAEGLSYVEIDDNGYVTWIENASAADFAAKAIAFATAETTKINPISTQPATADNTPVVFKDLTLGYYLVDSSLGALCALTTTNPTATVVEKNANPTLTKEVKEGANWGSKNDANIGDTVEFQATITVQGSAKDYVMHDVMDDGLTYGSVTGVTLNGTAVAKGSYTVKVYEPSDPTSSPDNDGCTFEVVFTKAFCTTLKSGDVIVVSYTATLNEKAVVKEPENNKAHLSYSDNNGETHKTEDSNTKTYTWEIPVLKYANDNTEKPLAGAKFTLFKTAPADPTQSAYSDPVKFNETATKNTYQVATNGSVTEITTDETGRFELQGLDAGTYYLKEIEAPAGYNKLDTVVTVTIDHDGKINATDEEPGGVTQIGVNNQSGTELPSTGGIGTTIFYVLGSALLIGAVVLLVARKRMNAEK